MTVDFDAANSSTSDVSIAQVAEHGCQPAIWMPLQYTEPKAVDGIKLSKGMEELAKSWWVERWLSIIEQFGLGARLERAKIYATRGQVLSVHIENGVVRAMVQGTDSEPYRVIIAVKTIPKSIWKSIMADFARYSRFGISLASKTMPPHEHIDDVFRNNGVLLYPDRQGELQTKCTCLDWSNPCKHIAAVYLLLASEFEREPFLIFKLRGLSQQDMFTLLQSAGEALPLQGESFALQNSSTSPLAKAEGVEEAHTELPTGIDCVPLPQKVQIASSNIPQRLQAIDVRNFWKKSVSIENLSKPWRPIAETAPVPQSLGGFPFWQGERDLLSCVMCVYESAPNEVMRLLAGNNPQERSN